jgi:hypothetical protein
MSWIEWCKCHRRILTTGQQEKKLPCEICQKEHAQGLKNRLDKPKEE